MITVRGSDLRAYRLRYGIGVGELAGLLHADPATVFRWERDLVRPPGCLGLALAELERRLRQMRRADRLARAKRWARRRAADPSDPRYW